MSDDDTRTRILNAAGECFAEKGFDNTTVREICRIANVNLAAVNYHFGDKEKLYGETIRYAHQFKTRQVPEPVWSPGTPPEVKLRDFVRTMLKRMLATECLPWQAQLMMREMLKPSGACREIVEDFVRPHFQQLLGILGEMLPDVEPHQRSQLGFSVIGQCVFYRFHQPIIEMLVPTAQLETHFQPHQLADHVANVILASLGRETLFHSDADANLVHEGIEEKQSP